jgi:DNA (cytosine-5)-methyltransferase 1
MGQISFFDGKHRFVLDKKIRLIELFGGIGSQAKALRNIGADFEHYFMCDFDKFAVRSYNAIHGTAFETSDITKLQGGDLRINEHDKHIYLLTYSFP